MQFSGENGQNYRVTFGVGVPRLCKILDSPLNHVWSSFVNFKLTHLFLSTSLRKSRKQQQETLQDHRALYCIIFRKLWIKKYNSDNNTDRLGNQLTSLTVCAKVQIYKNKPRRTIWIFAIKYFVIDQHEHSAFALARKHASNWVFFSNKVNHLKYSLKNDSNEQIVV